MSTAAANRYVLGHSNQELDRLISQGRYFGGLTAQVLREAGIAPGMRVLDVGCGAGDVSFLLANLVGPHGAVIGVDRSSDAVQLATRRAGGAALTNVHFIASDLQDLNLASDFDAIAGRLVLMYFPQPAIQLRRLAALLRPGGVAVFHEFDVTSGGSEPHLPLFTRAIDRIAEALRGSGADPRMGLRLPQTFRDAGLAAPQLMAHTRVGACGDRSAFDQIAGVTRTLLPAMEKLGIASAAEVDVDTLASRLAAEAAEQDATVVAPLFVGAWSRI